MFDEREPKVPKVPYSVAGSQLQNKTGAWRDKRPVVDPSRCTKCGLCALYCPDGAIWVDEKGAHIDYDYCKGCLVCVLNCPVKCISAEPENK